MWSILTDLCISKKIFKKYHIKAYRTCPKLVLIGQGDQLINTIAVQIEYGRSINVPSPLMPE